MSASPNLSPGHTAGQGFFRFLARIHDAITTGLFGVSMLATAYLTLVLSGEVIARYWMKDPSSWAPDTAAVSFALIIFLAAPMLARKNGHATMNLIVQALPVRASVWLQRFTMLLACVACLLSAWFGWIELSRLYSRGVTMITVTPIPKWWVMTTVVYGLVSAGLYYLRHLICLSCSQSQPGPRSGDS